MAPVERLGPDRLYRRCDPGLFDFETTAELDGANDFVGQPRALAAVHFGLGIAGAGYNLFALGPTGTGKRYFVEHFLAEQAARQPVPDDLCYLNNFAEPNKPRALLLPAGTGVGLRADLNHLVEEVSTVLPAAFETEEYQARLHAIEDAFKQRSAGRFEEIQERAQAQGIAMRHTPVGVMFTPLRDGEILSAEAFEQLAEEEQQRLRDDIEALQQEVQKVLREMPGWERERRVRVRELNREISAFAVGPLIDELRVRFSDYPAVVAYLDTVRQDFVDNARQLLQAKEQAPDQATARAARASGEAPLLHRYQVNVVVDRGDASGAPVIFEDNPSYPNLLGRIEHLAQMGALVTDFTLIRPGALHRANGGYLILEAHQLLQHPFAWEGLKRALKARQLGIEAPQGSSLISTVSLEPEPVPLEVKVVLLGDRSLYYLLSAVDPEFLELFKVAADFDDVIDRSDESQRRYANLIAALIQGQELRPYDRSAVARVTEQGARMAGDADKLSAHTASLTDLLREADYWAGEAGNSVVAADDVQRAVDAQTYRADRLRSRHQEGILRNTIYIDTGGAKVGQINGLSVIQVGAFAFGRPSRITARVRLGKGEVVDIEREVDLGGSLHAKGVLILASFLGARFGSEQPLSLSASLVFEQSCSGVEGDSASAAELYALLSAIAEVPIDQSFAITGSVNQHGEVQPIGGVNEKIEGFFDLCKARGLSGEQGVVIPASNVKHLMLREEVVEAVAADRFHIFPIETIDQGAELLMGLPMGGRDAGSAYPEGSLSHRVEERLRVFAARWKGFAASTARTTGS